MVLEINLRKRLISAGIRTSILEDTLQSRSYEDIVLEFLKTKNLYIHFFLIEPVESIEEENTTLNMCEWSFTIYKDTIGNLVAGYGVNGYNERFKVKTQAAMSAIKCCLDLLEKKLTGPKKHKVEICETLSKIIEVEASSPEEAVNLVRKRYHDAEEDVVLDSSHIVDTEFIVLPDEN
jgi:hypothetical protein